MKNLCSVFLFRVNVDKPTLHRKAKSEKETGMGRYKSRRMQKFKKKVGGLNAETKVYRI